MSTVAVPPTKTFGSRPPILPPQLTTYSGGSDDRDPYDRVLVDDVKYLLREIRRIHWSGYFSPMTALRLIQQRTSAVSRELDMHRMLATEVLPPTFMADLMDDESEDEARVVRTYVYLLGELAEAKDAILSQLRAQNGSADTSTEIDGRPE